MKENIRLFFSALWVLAFGVSFGLGIAVLISWGGFLEYFLAGLIVLAVATVGLIASSLP